jgi:hypothetical protein
MGSVGLRHAHFLGADRQLIHTFILLDVALGRMDCDIFHIDLIGFVPESP